ncbi:MAG: ABC transporter ATP-binding protein [Spirochaetaceae bacterium]
MITVDNLKFKYKNNKSETIHGMSFKVSHGEIFGFLGPSGAGKSTTQKILTGLNTGYSGSAKVNGLEINRQGREYYEDIGVSFELPNLYSQFTARENLDFFSSFYSGSVADIDNLLESVGLTPDADRKVSTFSKGMKMRLNFIRAFLNNPKLVFLDEPTSGLDPVNASLIKDIILEKRALGTTVFITTHNMQVASEICDRVAFVVDGEIKLTDTPKNLMYKYGKKEVRIEYLSDNETKIVDFDLETIKNNSEFKEIINTKELKTIHSNDATLDDVFIEVTGRSLK